MKIDNNNKKNQNDNKNIIIKLNIIQMIKILE